MNRGGKWTMILLGNLLVGLGMVIQFFINLFYFVLIGRIIASWVSADPGNPIVQFLYGATEPLLRPIRRRVPPIGILDISPLIVFAGLLFLDFFLVASLVRYGHLLAG